MFVMFSMLADITNLVDEQKVWKTQTLELQTIFVLIWRLVRSSEREGLVNIETKKLSPDGLAGLLIFLSGLPHISRPRREHLMQATRKKNRATCTPPLHEHALNSSRVFNSLKVHILPSIFNEAQASFAPRLLLFFSWLRLMKDIHAGRVESLIATSRWWALSKEGEVL